MDYDFSNEKRALLALSEKLNQMLLEHDALRADSENLRHIVNKLDWWMVPTEVDGEPLLLPVDRMSYLFKLQRSRFDETVAERDALRELAVEWQPFTEAAQDCQGSLLVWREDAGTFVAFYDDDARCWFTESGEDLTGDLPAFYAKMPKGPNE